MREWHIDHTGGSSVGFASIESLSSLISCFRNFLKSSCSTNTHNRIDTTHSQERLDNSLQLSWTGPGKDSPPLHQSSAGLRSCQGIPLEAAAHCKQSPRSSSRLGRIHARVGILHAEKAGAITVLLSIVVTEPFLAFPTRSSFLPVAIALLPHCPWHTWLAMGTPRFNPPQTERRRAVETGADAARAAVMTDALATAGNVLPMTAAMFLASPSDWAIFGGSAVPSGRVELCGRGWGKAPMGMIR